MEVNTVIVTTPVELRAIIADEIRAIVPVLSHLGRINEPVKPDGMTPKDAAKFLTEQGFPTSRASLYNLVSRGVAPYRKIGRRVIFSRKELEQWLTDNTVRPETQAVAAKRIAASANRKKL